MNSRLIFYIIGGVVGLGLLIAIAVSVTTGGSDETEVYGEVTVEGESLPAFEGNSANDAAVGTVAPTLAGQDFDGSRVGIEADGRPKVVLLLAHWCPHCQAEVPRVVQWLEAGNQPEGVDFYGVSTLLQRPRGNWPPAQWLDSEGWNVPTIQDDADNSASAAFGLVTTPYWVVLDGDNRVVARLSGELSGAGTEAISSLFQAAADEA